VKYLILLLLSFPAFATLNNVDKAEIFTKNIIKNGGFENGKAGWTASGGTFTTVISGTNLLTGAVSATWDSGSASQTLSYAAITIPKGLYGKNGVVACKIQTPSGTATHSLLVTDGSVTLVSGAVTSSTLPAYEFRNFIFPSSGTVVLRFTSVAADEPLIAIDDCFLGDAAEINLTSIIPLNIFSAQVSSADAVSAENTDWISGNCTNATTGKATCTFVTGHFTVAPNCTCTQFPGASVADNTCSIDTLSSSSVLLQTSSNGALADRAFALSCQKAGIDATQSAYRPDAVTFLWAGKHGNDCTWTSGTATLAVPSGDATCTFSDDVNVNAGTVASTFNGALSLAPGITFTPPTAGGYEICVTGNRMSANTTPVGLTWGLYVDSVLKNASGYNVGTGVTHSNTMCVPIAISSSGSASTISLRLAASSGTASLNDGAATAGTSDIRALVWSIKKLTQNIPAPLLVNSVTNTSKGVTGIEAANLNCSASSVILSQRGSWISSIGNIATGACVVTIAAGTFSGAPTCNLSSTGLANPNVFLSAGGSPSATSLTVDCDLDAGADCTTYDFNVLCMGPK